MKNSTSTNQLLTVTSNISTSEREYSTQILKKKYKKSIKAKTIPGYNRAKRNEGGVGKAISLMEAYWLLTSEQMKEEEKTLTMVNLLANHKGQLLTDRETIYWLHQKTPYVAGKKFNAGDVLEGMLELGIIKEYSKSYHTKGIAREAQIKEKKGLSDVIVKVVKFYIDSPLEDIIDELQDDASPKHKQVTRKINMELILEAAWAVSQQPLLVRRLWSAIGIITKFKRRQRKEGITVSLIQDLTHSLNPGYQPARKRYTVQLLANHYNLNPQTIRQTLDVMEQEEKEIQKHLARLTVIEQNNPLHPPLINPNFDKEETISLEEIIPSSTLVGSQVDASADVLHPAISINLTDIKPSYTSDNNGTQMGTVGDIDMVFSDVIQNIPVSITDKSNDKSTDTPTPEIDELYQSMEAVDIDTVFTDVFQNISVNINSTEKVTKDKTTGQTSYQNIETPTIEIDKDYQSTGIGHINTIFTDIFQNTPVNTPVKSNAKSTETSTTEIDKVYLSTGVGHINTVFTDISQNTPDNITDKVTDKTPYETSDTSIPGNNRAYHITEAVDINKVFTDISQNTPDNTLVNTNITTATPEDSLKDGSVVGEGDVLEEGLPMGNRGLLLSVDDIYNPSNIYTMKDLNKACAALRSRAASVMVDETALRVGAYNQAIAANILRYTPYDIVDMRQKEEMIMEGALPLEYQLCSPNSPRVYSREVDNLFYCRKRMRLGAFENLGFEDVDISGCHVEVALGLWGERLPLLGKHVGKGSLWSHYEEVYKAEGVPFYKSLMKAIHHATLLGGGMNAYREAHRSYNNHHPEAPIKEDSLEKIVEVFKSTDIYKELKALFRHLDKTFHNKSVTVLTGETFLVKGYRHHKDKKTGKVNKDKGNLLTVISAILQSFEVAMLSYLILRANQLFIPVLWQHDGLTIKALYSNTVELMQEVLDEFTLPLIHRSFKLERTKL